jgi:hypothetical protein
MTSNKHIAMWFCPRSRSTVIARAFGQLDECVVYDEPFYGAYLAIKGQDNYLPLKPEELSKYSELDYKKVINKITGELPDGASFSFQKHNTKHALPEFGRDWIKELKNFFLIRNPQETIYSYWQANYCQGNLKIDKVGWLQHFKLFEEIQQLTGETPLVIDSNELVKAPRKYLEFLCTKLGVNYSEKMLDWKPADNSLTWVQGSPYEHWYANALNTTKFTYEEKKLDLPNELMPLLEECMPYYQKIFQHRVVIN